MQAGDLIEARDLAEVVRQLVETGDLAEAGDLAEEAMLLSSCTTGASTPPAALTWSIRLCAVCDRDREPDAVAAAPLGGDRGVDADDLGVGVDERATRVARVDRRVGLDETGQRGVADREAAVEAADDAGGDRRREAERAAERDRALTDLDAVRLGEIGGREGRCRSSRRRSRGRAPASRPTTVPSSV